MGRNEPRRLPVWQRLLLWLFGLAAVGLVLFAGGQWLVKQLYPLEYTVYVNEAANENDIDPSLLYAMIHTESKFRPEAQSNAGAVGLMQLSEIAFTEAQMKRDGAVTLGEGKRLDPHMSVRYGSYYFGLMLQRFDNAETALAAYNAGPTQVAQWLKDSACSSDGETLSYIPYEETRNYVERVMQTQKLYQKLYQID